MDRRPLGRTGLTVSALGFGAFKIGRNEGIKYAQGYALPTDEQVQSLVDGLLDMGVNYFDTAPAYGVSEVRLARALGPRRADVVISTKVGEQFQNGRSTYDFSAAAVWASVQSSRARLGGEPLDLVFIHANADDMAILRETQAVETLESLKKSGDIRAIGLSAKTVEAAMLSLEWADALMLEYHLDDRSFEPVINAAHAAGVGVVIKKALASGRLSSRDALRFVAANPGVDSVVVGSLSLDHLRENAAAIAEGRQSQRR
jgi:aryl-alcohol dehydrogenase-like predicted oxidoreductase